jgi:hypothetical protein
MPLALAGALNFLVWILVILILIGIVLYIWQRVR